MLKSSLSMAKKKPLLSLSPPLNHTALPPGTTYPAPTTTAAAIGVMGSFWITHYVFWDNKEGTDKK